MRSESGPAGHFASGRDVHIIGAGVSGLLMAYYLKKAGHNVTVFEKERVGGKIQTKHTEAGPAEKAANAIYTSPEALELIAELGAARTGQFIHLVPAFGITMAILFLGEPLQGFHITGFLLILGGIWLATVLAKKRL